MCYSCVVERESLGFSQGGRYVVQERVVVTGLGVVAPNAHGKEAFSRALREGRSGIRAWDDLRNAGLACHYAAIPEGIDELKLRYLSEEERLATSQNMAFASIAAIDAWNDAGLSRSPSDSNEVDWDTGAIVGTGCASLDAVVGRLLPLINSGRSRRITSTLVEQTLLNGNSARVAGLLGLGNKVSTSCATGGEAIVEAFRNIRDGYAKRVLAGGSDGYSKYGVAIGDSLKKVCCRRYDAPEKASRPMSATASGSVPAAGAGILLFESLSSARSRGARIYAEALGGSVNSGGHRMGGGMASSNAEGVRRCILDTLTTAGIRPDQIDVINGELAGSLDDPDEVECWRMALDLPPAKMPLIQATKSLIGHTGGAAGPIECVAAALQLTEGFVHGSLNCEDLHPSLAPYADRIPHRTVLVPNLSVIAKTSFGFGDVNSCIIFRKFEG